MAHVDPETVPPKLSRIDKLMRSLEAGPQGYEKLPITNEQFFSDHDTFRHARQLILDLLGMSELSQGESIYKTVTEAGLAALDPEDRHPGPLEQNVVFVKRWTKDAFPADPSGKVPFGRLLLETLIHSAETHLAEIGRPLPNTD